MKYIPIKQAFLCSRNIIILSISSFWVILLVLLLSSLHMHHYIEAEAMAQKNRTELNALGESLANASDYLTDEVRKYVVTGVVTYLENYWLDVEVKKTRDQIIETIRQYQLPLSEQTLLKEAKAYSDLLIETEAYAMKLVLLQSGVSEADLEEITKAMPFIESLLAYELPEDLSQLNEIEGKNMAVAMLYDQDYTRYKTSIMTPIKTFQSVMNRRLNEEVEVAIAGRRRAFVVQTFCIILALISIGILLAVIYYLYIYPLIQVTDLIKHAPKESEMRALEWEDISFRSIGAYELRNFVTLFNQLWGRLHIELESRIQAEEEMRQARDEANKANQLKSEFLARMSHELRTPLNAMIGYLYLLGEGTLTKEQRGDLHNMERASSTLLTLINDILDFTVDL